jgi:hypothetical protein
MPSTIDAAVSPAFPLETATTDLGRHDLASAWRLANAAGSCEKLDIYRQIASEMVVWWAGRPDALEPRPHCQKRAVRKARRPLH